MVKRKLLFVTATTAIALLSGFIFRCPDAGTSMAGTKEAGAMPPSEVTTVSVEIRRQAPAETEPPELEQPEQRGKLLESVELDAETQWRI